jgi:hypothetical protein
MGQGGYPKNRDSRFATSELKIGCGRFGLNAALGTDVVLAGGGTSASPVTDATASPKFLSFYVSSTAVTGTARGMYMRLYTLSGGEAGRFYTTCSDDTPTDTLNGIHATMDFGSSAGNVTTQANAIKGTLGCPASRTLGGTNAAIIAELDVGTSAVLTNVSLFAGSILGAGKAVADDSAYFFSLTGATAGHGKLFIDHAPATLGGSLKVAVNGTTYYLGLYTTGGTS